MDPTYQKSLLHSLPIGFKLAVIFLISIVLFFYPRLWLSTVMLFIVYFLYIMAGFSFKKPLTQIRALWWIFIALFIIHYFSTDLENAFLVITRLAALFLLAALVTLTTPFAKLLLFLEKFFSFMRYFGVNPAKLSLALSMTLRFIPLFSELTKEVQEAQKARGLDNKPIALIMPVLIRSFKMQEDVAAAIEARCYDRE
ncbi:energy-coupling factor transporter transmembrane component T family protein [Bartonella tamiae]|uniref:Cobalt transport protein n=1 Tax=Bartonella tamiae Th239 TaxID=1094558 RepID=J1K268_9HYPH|nr:energy-coupling factor transporter transmembrane component T [Bartonella tamiae]EJF91557.1 hypothetical protein ME5_00252 [Bartonella tamiae Th239]EJF92459.1 hypothetical protein MEG_01629 [Bartonella tamiae Th307]